MLVRHLRWQLYDEVTINSKSLETFLDPLANLTGGNGCIVLGFHNNNGNLNVQDIIIDRSVLASCFFHLRVHPCRHKQLIHLCYELQNKKVRQVCQQVLKLVEKLEKKP